MLPLRGGMVWIMVQQQKPEAFLPLCWMRRMFSVSVVCSFLFHVVKRASDLLLGWCSLAMFRTDLWILEQQFADVFLCTVFIWLLCVETEIITFAIQVVAVFGLQITGLSSLGYIPGAVFVGFCIQNKIFRVSALIIKLFCMQTILKGSHTTVITTGHLDLTF